MSLRGVRIGRRGNLFSKRKLEHWTAALRSQGREWEGLLLFARNDVRGR